MKRAFTIVELLIVLAIIGIIAAVAIPTFRRQHEPPNPSAAFGMGEVTKAGKRIVEEVDYQNAAGQFVAILGKIDTLGPWLAAHHDCEIVSVAAVSAEESTYNPTTNIIIVYRRLAR